MRSRRNAAQSPFEEQSQEVGILVPIAPRSIVDQWLRSANETTMARDCLARSSWSTPATTSWRSTSSLGGRVRRGASLRRPAATSRAQPAGTRSCDRPLSATWQRWRAATRSDAGGGSRPTATGDHGECNEVTHCSSVQRFLCSRVQRGTGERACICGPAGSRHPDVQTQQDSAHRVGDLLRQWRSSR
jgi:hypothetical protein